MFDGVEVQNCTGKRLYQSDREVSVWLRNLRRIESAAKCSEVA